MYPYAQIDTIPMNLLSKLKITENVKLFTSLHDIITHRT